MSIKKLTQRGDTILEVLICIAVLGLIMAAAYALTNRNQLTAQQSQERSEALKIANTQLELLRAYGEKQPLTPLKDAYFCIIPSDPIVIKPLPTAPEVNLEADRATVYPNECQSGTDQRYKVAIWGYDKSSAINADNSGKHVFGVTVRWDSAKGGVREEVKTFYVTYDATGQGAPTGLPGGPVGPVSHIDAVDPGPLAPGSGTTINWNTESTAISCAAVNFPAPITLPPFSGSFATGPLPVGNHTYTIECSNALGVAGNTTSVTVNVPAPLPTSVITPSSYSFPAWHLAETGGTRQKRSFRVENPTTSPSDFRITTVSITGVNASSFRTINPGNCEGKTLKPGENCEIEVEFSPPTGGDNNRLGNAGLRSATLAINNSQGVSLTASLSGWTVSDRLAPGDMMYTTADGDDRDEAYRALRGYSPGCANNAHACPAMLVLWATGSLVIYSNAQTGAATWTTGGTGATRANMQAGDGNFVMYNAANAPVWATYWAGAPLVPNAWLKLYDGGALRLMNPSWNSNPDNGALWNAPGW